MKDKMHIAIDEFRAVGGVLTEPCEDGYATVWPEDGGRLILGGTPGKLGGVEWKNATHLVIELTGMETFNPAVSLVFMGGDSPESPSVIVNAGTIPGIRTKIAFPLDYLDSNRMFLPRTPGRLKAVIMGRGVELEQVERLILTTRKCHKPQHMVIHDIYLSSGEPDYTIEHEPVVDKLGQWKAKEWYGKTVSEEEMAARLREETENEQYREGFADWSIYGGDTSVRWEGTGYFRTHYDGERWYLADPLGYRFISTGLDCCRCSEGGLVTGIEGLFEELPDPQMYPESYEDAERGPGEDEVFVSYIRTNLKKAFGNEWMEKWTELIRSRMVDWHFNTIGNWSDPKFIKNARLPYVWQLEDFPTTKKCIFRDFPDVFSKEYEENAEQFAKQLGRFADDPYMIGYFLRNEPSWAFVQNLMIAEKVLENSEPSECKERLLAWLKEKYECIENLNRAWEKQYGSFEELRRPQAMMASYSEEARRDAVEFSRIMIRQFAKVPSLACKAVDSHHLNLGMRYSMLTDPVLLSGAEYFDVFSLNGYQENPYEEVQKAGEITGKPVMIGEFHFGAIDAGLPSCGISSVATQRDRGLAYREYYEKGMKSSYFVGAHYFILYDQPVLGRFDGENMQIGLLDVCSRPYEECIAEMKEVNCAIYEMADGRAEKKEYAVNRIPRLMGF